MLTAFVTAKELSLESTPPSVLSTQRSLRDEPLCREFIESWYRKVYAHCRSMLNSPVDCEDAAQEVFLRAHRNAQQVETVDAIGPWLRKIAHNVCVDMIRRDQVRKTLPLHQQTDLAQESCDTVSQRDQDDYLSGLVMSLPQNQREIILLHYYNEMTYDEMAEWLGVARSTVSQRLHSARQSLRSQIAQAEKMS